MKYSKGSLKRRDRTASHDNLMAFELQQLQAAKVREARMASRNARHHGGCSEAVSMGMGMGMSLAETEMMIVAVRQSLVASSSMAVSNSLNLVALIRGNFHLFLSLFRRQLTVLTQKAVDLLRMEI